jgi:hypothetical protein
MKMLKSVLTKRNSGFREITQGLEIWKIKLSSIFKDFLRKTKKIKILS